MNKIISLLAFIILFAEIRAQEKSRTLICGTTGPGVKVVYLSRVDYVNKTAPEILPDTVTDQTFRFETETGRPRLYRLYTGRPGLLTTTGLHELLKTDIYYFFNCYSYYRYVAEIFAFPGDSLHISLKFGKRGKNKSEYAGDRSDENKYLIRYRAKSQNHRGAWVYSFFGLGSSYKERPPGKVIEKANREKDRFQQRIDRHTILSRAFRDYLTNDNLAAAFQLASNVLNGIDSTHVRLFFEKGKPFPVYENLYTRSIPFRPPRAFERALFVYMELMSTYQLNLTTKQVKTFYDKPQEKYYAGADILEPTLFKWYGTANINQMLRDTGNTGPVQQLISDYNNRFPDSRLLNN